MGAAEKLMHLHGPGGKANREFLANICDAIYTDEHREEGKTKNEVLIDFYESCGYSDFRTYRQWKEAGKQVKKGEQAFLVWAKPLSSKQAEAAKAKGEEAPAHEGPEFFPLCYLFAASQVE
jgi:hypothetical protein